MFNINGDEWRILMVSPFHPQLQRSDGHFALGCCDSSVMTIYLSEDIKTSAIKKVLCHELAHAAMFSHDIIISREEEELIADLIASFGEEIVNNTDAIFKRIKKIRDQTDY